MRFGRRYYEGRKTMIEICALFSGSSGNCTYIEADKTALLLDAGMSMKRIFAEIDRIGKDINNIKAIFVTHEHSDHIRGLGPVARRLGIPIFATNNTWRAMYRGIGVIDEKNIMPVEFGKTIEIGSITVNAFSIPHDAAQPCGYSFSGGGKRITVATDIGEMHEDIFNVMSGSDGVLLESNHDIGMLMNGCYPYYLKQRIRGKNGHLSNDDASEVVAKLVSTGTKTLLLGHLSAENNRPEIALASSCEAIEKTGVRVGEDVKIEVLERGKAGRLIAI